MGTAAVHFSQTLLSVAVLIVEYREELSTYFFFAAISRLLVAK